jgi:hypothetical protein
MHKMLATIADPVEAVQFSKTRSICLLGWFTDREDKFTPEARAEAEQIAELLLAGHPRKNAQGETIQMSIDEAFALYDEQDKVQRRGLEHVSLSPPPTFPKVDLPLAVTAAPKGRVTFIREILATIADPVAAAVSAKDNAIWLMKDLPEYSEFSFTPEGEMLIKDPNEYSEFTFTPEEIAEAKRVAEILLAGLPCNQQQHITKESDKDQRRAQARLTLQRHSWLKPYLAGLASSLSSPPKKPNGAAPASNVVDNSGRYEPVTRDAPELAKLEAVWVTRIFDGDVDGKYQNDRSQLAFAVACELVRAGFDDGFIARVLMTTKCGVYVQEANPAYGLAGTLRRAHDFVIDPDLEAMNSKQRCYRLATRPVLSHGTAILIFLVAK